VTTTSNLGFSDLVTLISGGLGIHDVPCPLCGPERRHPINRKRRVLRVWYEQPNFISYYCARCGARGYAHDGDAQRIHPQRVHQLTRKAEEHQVQHLRRRRKLAQWLWEGAEPIDGTPAERYLRTRKIRCPLPATLRFRAGYRQHPPAMMTAFGIPSEHIPGVLDVEDMLVHGVHITHLNPDGSGKAKDSEGREKLMIGPSMGLPIVVAPANDLGGLCICEGIEDALSLHQITGLGAWVAGCASRLPALARAVPQYVTSVTISVDDNDAGRRYSQDLARHLVRIRGRRFEIIMLEGQEKRAAA
jgi:hypothetical protein